MANATDPGSTLGLFNLGNGLIEIAALTSLIGSAAAESLALGDKGPTGLVWATMTIFGAMSVVTLFTATATPGWLRDSVGVRSAKSDAVVGLSLDLNKSFKYRGRGEPAKAVECEIQIVGQVNHHGRLMVNLSRSVVAKRRETSH
jgi:hypothetical protein